MKHLVKGLLGRTAFASRLDALLLRQRAVVVAFHRVRPTAADGDGLTISVPLFERYCRFFRRHFRVVPLRDLVDRLERGVALQRELAITFDDGYRDNFDHAAPVLERLALPATFFVVSDWMGTDVVPWWDREQGVRHPWMTWEQVRSLQQRGFEIGAHTRTHADLGRVSDGDAKDEILGARLELEHRLGTAVELFAYPYGGAGNLLELNRELVKDAGFRCCCSCFGGLNARGTDPLQLRRIAVSSWYRSPYQFGFDVAFGRTLLT
jgi:peptidoglycan/xylan/chitin deacetylase (PgdA/CDA1 family)